ncbi:MAG: CoA pyrophosphatase [Syntrophaceae bacterium]|nr:CoA pyrophosphatase [Syntrophaceae bacterium]
MNFDISLFSAILSGMGPDILRDPAGFRQRVIDALSGAPVDYAEQFGFIKRQEETQEKFAGGAVLLPLFFREGGKSGKQAPGEYVFLLNKRSQKVLQPGDLCAPGGGIHPFLDSLTQKLLRLKLLPGIGGPGLGPARRRGREDYDQILFLLGNALRESWEELRLSPFNVEFLGPLPTYPLSSRRWIIFPLVGRVKHSWKPRLSWEVEKIIPIPLSAFFKPENYAIYSLAVPEKLMAQGIPSPWEFPCLVHRQGGEEDILWGATFKVIQTFFQIVLNFPFPSPDPQRVIRRSLASNYLTGREEP